MECVEVQGFFFSHHLEFCETLQGRTTDTMARYARNTLGLLY